MKKYKTMDGNEACAHVAYMFTEVAGIYPITPASTMAEHVDDWASAGRKNLFGSPVKVIEMQSEAGAAGMLHGSLQNGALSTTFTASQGLLLMIPNMYKMSGEMLPAIIHVAARSIATHSLSILGDHQDIYAARMTGFAMLANSSVQQIMDLTGVAHLSAIKSSIPFLNFFDGFRTSHELQKIEVLEDEDFKDLIDYKAIEKFRKNSLSEFNKVIRGTASNEDVYFQMTEVRNKYYDQIPDIVNDYMKKISEKTGRNYAPFVYYGHSNAKRVIVAMGSICETIKETIDYLNSKGERLGLVEVHLYRPFSEKYFFNVLPKSVEKIAVLDRTKEPGSSGEPLYLDVVNMFNNKKRKPFIIGGRYGLSSKDTSAAHVKAVFEFLDSRKVFNGFTVGIEDDVTHLSIEVEPFNIEKENTKEFLIYGYGSDGMMSCSKDIIKLIGDNTENKVQGYFQYDSKKSGGLTRSHIRISNSDIRSEYYINNPSLVVCSKESYLGRYDMLSNIKQNGTFIYVTAMNEEEVNKLLPNSIRKLMVDRNIKFYTIDAYSLANKYGLKNKISTVLETCILKIILVDFKSMFEKEKESVKNMFQRKGESVVQSNLKVIDEALDYLKEIKIHSNGNEINECRLAHGHEKDLNKIFTMMNNLEGNELKVSDFLDYKDGTYISGTTQFEKRGIAENLPEWIPANCIQCNQCSFVCPHSVIRPYLLNKEEFEKAPDNIKTTALQAIGTDYKFQIGISTLDCTGCGLCANICPGKAGNKALVMKPFEEVSCDNGMEYLSSVSEKEEQFKPTVKGSQFKKPLFEYSGACAGCGETPYIKVLTQLFGDRMIIANATGCSSIYGASLPSMPYKLPWANSLFEDNAEYGYGMLVATNTLRAKIKELMEGSKDKVSDYNKELFDKWLNNYDDYDVTKEVYDRLDYSEIKEIEELKQYIPSRSIWTVGGDGWAYDIGFGGVDHVLSSNQNVNILVLDTEVYSNTGGQSSKSSNRGSIAKFASSGKKTQKKDLARIAMCYPNTYVAQISMGANMQQTINAFMEAEKHNGPSIVIAYSTCINHGIKKGMEYTTAEQRLAVQSGYFPMFRYNPLEKKLNLDYKEPNFDLFNEFLENENRFAMLKVINKDKADELLASLKEEAMDRFNYYKGLSIASNVEVNATDLLKEINKQIFE